MNIHTKLGKNPKLLRICSQKAIFYLYRSPSKILMSGLPGVDQEWTSLHLYRLVVSCGGSIQFIMFYYFAPDNSPT